MKKIIPKGIGATINIMAYIAPRYAGKLGFNIFCRPLRTPVKAHHKTFLESSEKFSFNYQGTCIQGYRWGNGEKKVLLLHGWQSHSARWKNIVHAFPESQYRLYALDAPGHGLSGGRFFNAKLYGEIIHHFAGSLGQIHCIIAHSLGGFSTLFALSHFNPFHINRVVIMATPGEAKDFVAWFRQKMNLSEKSLECIRHRFNEKIGKPYDYFSISRFAEQLHLPGLIIHDREDRFAPFHYAEVLNRKWKGSTLIATEGLGHNLKGENVVEYVVDFVRKRTNSHPDPVNFPMGSIEGPN